MSSSPATPPPFKVYQTTIKYDGTNYYLDPSVKMKLGDAVQVFADDQGISYELTVSIKEGTAVAGSVNVHS